MKIIIEILLLIIAFPYVRVSSCPANCSDVVCHNPTNCTGSMVPDDCNCCKRCAKIEGETCGGKLNMYGPCDKGLKCVLSKKLSKTGICQRGEYESKLESKLDEDGRKTGENLQTRGEI